jgi:hypothetical protein
VRRLSPGTIRTWLRQDQSPPWRSHAGQHATDPPCVAKAAPVLDLYAPGQALAEQGAAVVCRDEQTAMQARQRVRATPAAAPGVARHGAARAKRRGAVHLCCALLVASGLTWAPPRTGRQCVAFPAFLRAGCQSAWGAGWTGVPRRLDHGATQAPTQLGAWMASRELSFAGRISWWPTHASWLDQVESICSTVPRARLTPNALPSPLALEKHLKTYLAALHRHPKPMQWTYTKTKLALITASATLYR